MGMIKTNRLRSYNEIVSSEINQMCSCSYTAMNTCTNYKMVNNIRDIDVCKNSKHLYLNDD